jgi:hypothetical protein
MQVEDIKRIVSKIIKERNDLRITVSGIDDLPIIKGENPKIIAELYIYSIKLKGRVFLITNDKKFEDYFTNKDLLDIYNNITGYNVDSISDSVKNNLLQSLFRYASVLGYVQTSRND